MKITFLLLSIISLSCKKPLKSYDQAILECDKKMLEPSTSFKITNTCYPTCLIGSKIPTITALTIDNHKIDSSYFMGKITVLNFWFIGCHPCLAQIPGLNTIQKKFREQKVNFLAIGRNSRSDIKDFLNEHDWPFDQISNEKNIIENVFKIKSGYPTTFIIDKELKIIEALNGGFSDPRTITDIENKIIPVLQRELNR